LTNKKYLYNEAERLYLYDFMTIDEVAARLKLNRKTIMAWKADGDWEIKRKDFLKSKKCFHEELYELARNLLNGISSDLAKGEKVDAGRMYAFCKIIPMFTKVKDYEDIVNKKEKSEAPKGLTAETIAKIEREVLGITHDDSETE